MTEMDMCTCGNDIIQELCDASNKSTRTQFNITGLGQICLDWFTQLTNEKIDSHRLHDSSDASLLMLFPSSQDTEGAPSMLEPAHNLPVGISPDITNKPWVKFDNLAARLGVNESAPSWTSSLATPTVITPPHSQSDDMSPISEKKTSKTSRVLFNDLNSPLIHDETLKCDKETVKTNQQTDFYSTGNDGTENVKSTDTSVEDALAIFFSPPESVSTKRKRKTAPLKSRRKRKLYHGKTDLISPDCRTNDLDTTELSDASILSKSDVDSSAKKFKSILLSGSKRRSRPKRCVSFAINPVVISDGSDMSTMCEVDGEQCYMSGSYTEESNAGTSTEYATNTNFGYLSLEASTSARDLDNQMPLVPSNESVNQAPAVNHDKFSQVSPTILQSMVDICCVTQEIGDKSENTECGGATLRTDLIRQTEGVVGNSAIDEDLVAEGRVPHETVTNNKALMKRNVSHGVLCDTVVTDSSRQCDESIAYGCAESEMRDKLSTTNPSSSTQDITLIQPELKFDSLVKSKKSRRRSAFLYPTSSQIEATRPDKVFHFRTGSMLPIDEQQAVEQQNISNVPLTEPSTYHGHTTDVVSSPTATQTEKNNRTLANRLKHTAAIQRFSDVYNKNETPNERTDPLATPHLPIVAIKPSPSIPHVQDTVIFSCYITKPSESSPRVPQMATASCDARKPSELILNVSDMPTSSCNITKHFVSNPRVTVISSRNITKSSASSLHVPETGRPSPGQYSVCSDVKTSSAIERNCDFSINSDNNGRYNSDGTYPMISGLSKSRAKLFSVDRLSERTDKSGKYAQCNEHLRNPHSSSQIIDATLPQVINDLENVTSYSGNNLKFIGEQELDNDVRRRLIASCAEQSEPIGQNFCGFKSASGKEVVVNNDKIEKFRKLLELDMVMETNAEAHADIDRISCVDERRKSLDHLPQGFTPFKAQPYNIKPEVKYRNKCPLQDTSHGNYNDSNESTIDGKRKEMVTRSRTSSEEFNSSIPDDELCAEASCLSQVFRHNDLLKTVEVTKDFVGNEGTISNNKLAHAKEQKSFNDTIIVVDAQGGPYDLGCSFATASGFGVKVNVAAVKTERKVLSEISPATENVIGVGEYGNHSYNTASRNNIFALKESLPSTNEPLGNKLHENDTEVISVSASTNDLERNAIPQQECFYPESKRETQKYSTWSSNKCNDEEVVLGHNLNPCTGMSLYSSTTVNSLFKTASGNEVKISAKSLEHVKKVFADPQDEKIEDSVSINNSEIQSIAERKHIPFMSGSNTFVNMDSKTNSGADVRHMRGGLYSTACGGEVTISKTSLEKGRKSLHVDTSAVVNFDNSDKTGIYDNQSWNDVFTAKPREYISELPSDAKRDWQMNIVTDDCNSTKMGDNPMGNEGLVWFNASKDQADILHDQKTSNQARLMPNVEGSSSIDVSDSTCKSKCQLGRTIGSMFSTASGRSIKISDESLKHVRNKFCDDLVPLDFDKTSMSLSNRVEQNPSSCDLKINAAKDVKSSNGQVCSMFASASGKQVTVSERALHAVKNTLFGDEEMKNYPHADISCGAVAEGKGSINTEKNCATFMSAAGDEVNVSKESLSFVRKNVFYCDENSVISEKGDYGKSSYRSNTSVEKSLGNEVGSVSSTIRHANLVPRVGIGRHEDESSFVTSYKRDKHEEIVTSDLARQIDTPPFFSTPQSSFDDRKFRKGRLFPPLRSDPGITRMSNTTPIRPIQSPSTRVKQPAFRSPFRTDDSQHMKHGTQQLRLDSQHSKSDSQHVKSASEHVKSASEHVKSASEHVKSASEHPPLSPNSLGNETHSTEFNPFRSRSRHKCAEDTKSTHVKWPNIPLVEDSNSVLNDKVDVNKCAKNIKLSSTQTESLVNRNSSHSSADIDAKVDMYSSVHFDNRSEACQDGSGRTKLNNDLSEEAIAMIVSAQVEQDAVIVKKRRQQSVRPSPGRLWLLKTEVPRGGRIRLKYASLRDDRTYNKAELRSMGVNASTLSVTSLNAATFTFDLCDLYGTPALRKNGGILVGDDIKLVPDVNGVAGWMQFYRALCTHPHVDPRLIEERWVQNHYRWIVWKLAAYEVALPSLFASVCLTPDKVMTQLKYRYDREIDHAQRSCIKKITERDDTAGKRMVLCVSRIRDTCGGDGPVIRGVTPKSHDATTTSRETQPAGMDLTDGWYSIRCCADPALLQLLNSGAISVGDKLCIHSAELVGLTEPCSPLDLDNVTQLPESAMLKLHMNSTRRARWFSRLGYQALASPMLVSLYGVHGDGGIVGTLDVVVQRIYPELFMEKTEGGGCVFRDRKAEAKAADAFGAQRQRLLDDMCSKITAEIHHTEDNKLHRRKMTRSLTKRTIDDLHTGHEIYEAVAASLEPESIHMMLSDEQRRLLEMYQQERVDKERAKMEALLQERMADAQNTLPQRNVVPLRKYRIAGCSARDVDCKKTSLLTIWRPDENLTDLLQEDDEVEERQALLSESAVRIQNTTLKKYSASFEGLDEHTGFNALFARKTPQSDCSSLETVYAADRHGDVLAIRFWSGLRASNADEILTINSVFLAMNLLFKQTKLFPLVTLDASPDITVFSQSGSQEVSLQIHSLQASLSEAFLETSRSKVDRIMGRTSPYRDHSPAQLHLSSPLTDYVSSNKTQNLSHCNEKYDPSSGPVTPTMSARRRAQKQRSDSKKQKLLQYSAPPNLPPFVSPIHKSVRTSFRPPRKILRSPPPE